MTGRHPDPTKLVAYAHGLLDPAEADEIREHCESCRDCGNQLAAVLLLRQGREASSRSERRWIAAAAAVLVVGLGVGSYWVSGWWSGQADSAPAYPAVAENSPRGERPGEEVVASEFADLASRRIPESFFRPFEMAIERFGAIPADVGSPPVVPILGEAIAAMKRGEHGRAAELLTPCCGGERFHKWGTVILGVALFAEGEHLDRAAAALERVAENRPMDEGHTALWYLANLRLVQDRPDAARELLGRIDRRTAFGEDAAELGRRIEERLRSREEGRR